MRRKNREDVIDDLMAYLALSDFQPIGGKFHHLPISYFREADPSLFLHDVFDDVDMGRWYDPAETVESLDEPLDYTILGIPQDENAGSKFALQRLRIVTPKEVRGRVRKIYPKMYEDSLAFVFHNGTYQTARTIVGETPSRMVDILYRGVDEQGRPCGIESDMTKERVGLIVCQQFLKPYLWRVVIESELGASLSFFSSPVGMRELFRFRDIPEGRRRRAAIRNWISEHWRRKHDDPESATWVRKHLRGTQTFRWNGLRITIHVPNVEYEDWLKQKQENAA